MPQDKIATPEFTFEIKCRFGNGSLSIATTIIEGHRVQVEFCDEHKGVLLVVGNKVNMTESRWLSRQPKHR